MSLDQIALRTGTDKSSRHHGYTKYYEQYFEPFRNEPITIIDGGYGGYIYYDRGGMSAKMWREYFHKANIITFDLYDKQPIEGVRVYKGSQDDPVFLNSMIDEVGVPDIIIDDLSHINPLTIRTFEILWPRLKSGGIYCIEDLETSYWKENYQGSQDPNAPTIMNYLKGLTDTLNDHVSGKPSIGIEYIHFYREMVFIKKK